jgi:hypothetical protein
MMTTRTASATAAAWVTLALLLLPGCGEDDPPAAPGPSPARPDGSGGPSQVPDAAVDAPVVPDAGVDMGRRDGPLSGDVLPESDGPAVMSMIFLYPVPAPVEAACQRYAEVQCARWKACTPDRFTRDYNSEEMCRARRESACRTDFIVPGRGETAADRMACSQAWTALSCRDVFLNRRVPACDAPPGTLTVGQACFRASQCARGLSCQIEVESCGTCQPAIPAGGDCGWWAGGCPTGTTCYDDRCLPELKAAEACKTSSAPCQAGLECLAQGCTEKTADRGASCAAGDLCDPVKGLYCNVLTGLCEPVPAPAPVGERCNTFSAEGGPLECSPDATCYSASTAVGAVRRCVARADLGMPCDTSMGINCKLPAACARGTCVMPTIIRGGTYMPPMCR